MGLMHRFSPFSTGAIKRRNNGVVKKKKKNMNQKILNDNELVNLLLDLGFTFERSLGCLSYLEKKNLENALFFFDKIEPNLT